MSQPPVTETLPPPPSDAATSPPPHSTTGKRRREDDDETVEGTSPADIPSAKKRSLVEQEVVYRIVVQPRQIGKVIGRVGHRIKKIRVETNATVKVADAVSRHEERVIIISSVDNDNAFCDAENGLDQIVTLILMVLVASVEVISISSSYKHGHNRGAQHFVDPSSAEYVSLEIMVPEALVGGLIGRCGSNISRIRSESGATIKVYGGKGEGNQRQIHLGGSSQQVALAKLRVDEYVFGQLMLQPGGQQPKMPEDSNTLYQGYGQDHGLYSNSNLSHHGMMASLPPMPPMPQLPQIPRVPQMYPGSNANQVPYYDQSFQAPQSYYAPM